MSAVTAALVASVTCRASRAGAGAAREDPRHPRVHGAEAQLAGGRPGAVGIDGVENGHQLGGRRVGGEADAFGLQRQAGADGAEVLPPDARGQRLAGGALPDDGRRSLVGDPDGLDGASVAECGVGHVEDGVGHQRGVELHQARRRGVGQDGGVVHMVDRGIGSHEGRTHP